MRRKRAASRSGAGGLGGGGSWVESLCGSFILHANKPAYLLSCNKAKHRYADAVRLVVTQRDREQIGRRPAHGHHARI